MKVVLFLVIFSLVANSQASLPFKDQSFEGRLAPNGVDIQNMTLPVFGSLSLTHKKGAILVCIRRLVQPEINTRRWSPTTCSSYLDLRNVTDSGTAAASRIVLNSRSVLTKQGSQYPLPIELLEGLYFIGFFSDKATNYSVDLTANTCADGYFGDQCAVKVDSTLPFNSSAPISLAANETKIYQLTPTTTNSSYLLQHVEFTGEFDPTSVIVSRVKSLNIPTRTDYEGLYTFSEAHNQTKFILPSPSTYRWFVSLKSTLAANFHLIWNSTQCDMGKVGPSCQDVSVLSGVNTTQAQIFTTGASDWQYFQWDLNANNSFYLFSFTVQNFASNGSAPGLYFRLGQVPTEDSYDLRVINNTINRVESAQAAYGSWYIGVKGNGLKYGFWYNGQCANNCSDHGTCEMNPDGSYQCVCDDLYTNFDCSKRQNLDGFRKVYLVIIIIGAALFGVAGLGFFCLIVMRRKRVEGYEILSQT